MVSRPKKRRPRKGGGPPKLQPVTTLAPSIEPRPEDAVFADLEKLCGMTGYVHALSYLIFRDSVVTGDEEFQKADFEKIYSRERLIRTEFEILIGLWLKGGRETKIPESSVIQLMIERSDALLNELHEAILAPAHRDFVSAIEGREAGIEVENPLGKASAMREAIFYGGESAFSFQYSSFSSQRYAQDREWLEQNFGFNIRQAEIVFDAVITHLAEKIPATMMGMRLKPMNEWTMLPLFTFDPQDIVEATGFDKVLIGCIIAKFSEPDARNESYTRIDDLNDAVLYPFVPIGSKVAFFLEYTGTGAIYNSPAYWMRSDNKYIDRASQNRGEFTEKIVEALLARSFPNHRIYKNIILKSSKKITDGEVDIILVHGKRAFIFQLKSKGLTDLAKSGNDQAITRDFANAVQHAYDQAVSCIDLIKRETPTYVNGKPFAIPGLESVDEFYPVCITSEHYPSLSFQVKQFLKLFESTNVKFPIVMDIFTLDAITEFLRTPLYVVDYLSKRSDLYDRVMSSHELVTLAYHLRGNLFVPKNVDFMMVKDDFMIEIDLAMNVRRRKIPGQATPNGILTRDLDNPLGRILDATDRTDRWDVHQLGEFLLNIHSDSWQTINRWLVSMIAQAKQDGRSHDVTVPLDEDGVGLTVHCNDFEDQESYEKIAGHCELRKYTQKADRWFGVCLSTDGQVRFALGRQSPWKYDAVLEPEARALKVRSANHWVDLKGRRANLGRNDPCPCGSGKKYKKCCLQ